MAGHNNLELEIHSLFQEGHSPDYICQEIISKYERSEAVSTSEIESLSHFLIANGEFHLLFRLYSRCLRKDSLATFPWGYFIYAVEHCLGHISEDLISFVADGIEEQTSEDSCTKIPRLIQTLPIVSQRLRSKRDSFELSQLEQKAKLISQLNQNRLYQLADQEEQTLQQLIKSFPRDIEVQLLYQAHLEKKADEILSKVKNQSLSRSRKISQMDLSSQEVAELIGHIRQVSEGISTTAPDQLYNMAILAMHLELYDLSIEVLNRAPRNLSSEWLKAEVLFASGRHLDLLKHIEEIEKDFSTTPESTYGAVYLKAQAYYGLGQKDLAIQLLESLSQTIPSYRSTEALLHEWKSL